MLESIQRTKAKKGRGLARDEERFVFKTYSKFSKKSKALRRKLKNGKLNGQRKMIEVELALVDETKKMLISLICDAYNKLMWSVAQRARGRRTTYSMDPKDLFQESYFGMSKVIEKFDYRRDSKFSSYAWYWLRQSVTSAINKKERTIKVPHRTFDIIAKANNFTREYHAMFNRNPDIPEIVEATGHRVEEVKRALDAKRSGLLYELDENSYRQDGKTIFDDAAAQELSNKVARCLAVLKPREQEIIMRRNGLNGRNEETLEAIGIDMNVTRERIRQIEAGALSKVRREAEKLGLHHLFHAS